MVKSERDSKSNSKSKSQQEDESEDVSNSMSDYDDDSDEGDDERARTAKCIRNVGNFSSVKPHDLMDRKNFMPDLLAMRMPTAAPKLMRLFEKIAELDAADMHAHGKLFKHMIFTDLRSSIYGARVIASAFVAKEFNPAFSVHGTGFTLWDDANLLETRNTNFGVLMSKPFFDRSMSVRFKKALLDKYNQRNENTHGALVRFIILDQGFKEGIDLFDVKYVHLMEPLLYRADEKQAIGRGTRFCGQAGLVFHPTYGWPLYVMRYDASFNKDRTLTHMYMNFVDIDIRRVMFAAELERVAKETAVDFELTAPVHKFKIELPPAVSGGAQSPNASAKPPPRQLKHAALSQYVRKHYGQFTYPPLKLENKCASVGGAAGNIDVEFTPTQEFVRHYFTPASPYKGILFYHNPGSGKTCSAIATATTTWEPQGYNIMWVTRHTLKTDIFKNMFRQVCSLVIQKEVRDGKKKLPKTLVGPMKHLSDRWVEPMSYRQFTNLLAQKNKFYAEMVRRNGADDPLRKTLLIIDEAHKLYAKGVAAAERPDSDKLEQMIQRSYAMSGDDSVRVMLMTATPFTEDGMEMMQLLNLLRPKSDAIPTDFDAFSNTFLDANGTFSGAGKTRFANAVAGYVSYLDRSTDARNFAYPVLEDVRVPISRSPAKRERDEDGKLPKKSPTGMRLTMAEKKDNLKLSKQQLKYLKGMKKKEAEDYMETVKAEAKVNANACAQAVDLQIASVKQEQKGAVKDCNVAHKPGPVRKACVDGVKATQEARIAELKVAKKACKQRITVGTLRDAFFEQDVELSAEKATMLATETEVNALKEEMADIREQRRKYTEAAIEIAPDIDENKTALKAVNAALAKAKRLTKTIQNVDERKKATKAIRAGLGADSKALDKKVKDMQADVSLHKLRSKVLGLKLGSSALGDLSQEKALAAKCKITVIPEKDADAI